MRKLTAKEMIEAFVYNSENPAIEDEIKLDNKWVMVRDNGSRFLADVYLSGDGVPMVKYYVESIDKYGEVAIQLLMNNEVFEELVTL